MIDPNCFDGGDKPCNNNFIWFAFFLILSVSMFALTVKGLISLITDDSCGKKELETTQIIEDNNNEI